MDCQDPGFIKQGLPHRPPFLWVDKVLEINRDFIKAEKYIPEDLEIFQGHYPDYPLVPGVLLCEAVFQAGALLIRQRAAAEERQAEPESSVPVLTRILGAKFKREVRPGDRLEISVEFTDRVGAAWFLKGAVKVDGKVAVQVKFACMQKTNI